jgi:hypothetical protein
MTSIRTIEGSKENEKENSLDISLYAVDCYYTTCYRANKRDFH